MVDPSLAVWFLPDNNQISPGFVVFPYGQVGWIPVVGQWQSQGPSTVGGFDPSSATWYAAWANAPDAPDITFQFGTPT
jgi:hypothetical protein